MSRFSLLLVMAAGLAASAVPSSGAATLVRDFSFSARAVPSGNDGVVGGRVQSSALFGPGRLGVLDLGGMHDPSLGPLQAVSIEADLTLSASGLSVTSLEAGFGLAVDNTAGPLRLTADPIGADRSAPGLTALSIEVEDSRRIDVPEAQLSQFATLGPLVLEIEAAGSEAITGGAPLSSFPFGAGQALDELSVWGRLTADLRVTYAYAVLSGGAEPIATPLPAGLPLLGASLALLALGARRTCRRGALR